MGSGSRGARADAVVRDVDLGQQPGAAGARGARGVAHPETDPSQTARSGAVFSRPPGHIGWVSTVVDPLCCAWRIDNRQGFWYNRHSFVRPTVSFTAFVHDLDLQKYSNDDDDDFDDVSSTEYGCANGGLLDCLVSPDLLLDAGSVHCGGYGHRALLGAASTLLLLRTMHVQGIFAGGKWAGLSLVRCGGLPPGRAPGGSHDSPAGVRRLLGFTLTGAQRLHASAGAGVDRGPAAL